MSYDTLKAAVAAAKLAALKVEMEFLTLPVPVPVPSPTPTGPALYVSADGSDTANGAILTPVRTFTRALALAKPGTTILVRGGNYMISRQVVWSKSGTAAAPITIKSYGSEVPVFDASPMTVEEMVFMLKASYVNISGLELTKGGKGGIELSGAHHCRIERLNVHRCGRLSRWEGKGVVLSEGSSHNLLLEVESNYNKDIAGDNADGFQLYGGVGNVLQRTGARYNSDDGYDCYNVLPAGSGNLPPVVFDACEAEGNGYDEFGKRTTGNGMGFKLGGQREGAAGAGNGSGGNTCKDTFSWGNATAPYDDEEATIPNIYIRAAKTAPPT